LPRHGGGERGILTPGFDQEHANVRFAGRLRWNTAPSPPISSPPSLLGEGAVDCSAADSARSRLSAWWPPGDVTDRGLAARAGVTVLFTGYLRRIPPPHRDEAAYVLERYRADDWGWLRGANGVFAFAVVDEAADRCVLAVDRLGIRPLFYTSDAAAVSFAGTLAAALGRTGLHECDYDTLQELLVLGFPLSQRTFLRGVERVPPGTMLDIRSGVIRSARYWSIAEVAPPRRQPLEPFLDESRERLRHVLRDLLPRSQPSTVCLLSSGYDSRRLLLEAHALGAPLTVITSVWPYPDRAGTTIEPGVTGELCRRLGLSRRLVAFPGLPNGVDPVRARTVRDVLLDFQVYGRHHVWSVPVVAAIPPSIQQFNLDGMAGDTFLNNPFYSLPRAAWGRGRPDADILDCIVPPRADADGPWGGLLSRSLRARVESALRALPEGPNRLSFFYLLGRTRAMVALLPYGLLDLSLESYCPYLDHDVMDHALSLDPVLKGERRLQELALRRHFPSLADIPSSHSAISEVPSRYIEEMAFTDPDHPGRVRLQDVTRLVQGALHGRPRPSHRDLAFAVLSTLGLLGRKRGRERHVRNLLQAARALALFRHADDRLVRARSDALAWVQRLRSLGGEGNDRS